MCRLRESRLTGLGGWFGGVVEGSRKEKESEKEHMNVDHSVVTVVGGWVVEVEEGIGGINGSGKI